MNQDSTQVDSSELTHAVNLTREGPDLPDVLWPVAAEGDAAADHALLVVIVLHGLLGNLRRERFIIEMLSFRFLGIGITSKRIGIGIGGSGSTTGIGSIA